MLKHASDCTYKQTYRLTDTLPVKRGWAMLDWRMFVLEPPNEAGSHICNDACTTKRNTNALR